MGKKKRKTYSVPDLNFDKFTLKINELENYFLSSEFYKNFHLQLQLSYDALKIEHISHILCYGLGNFATNFISRYQLILLLLLKDSLKVPVYLYDPVFSKTEINYLKRLNLKIIPKNEEGARKIEVPTLIFLPHCPTAIINNLLWFNWNVKLSNCIIFGNSFHELISTFPLRIFKEQFFYVFSILPFTKEIFLDNTFKHTDIFNQMSLHIFPLELINEIPSTVWKFKEKPHYDDTSNFEFVTNKMSNLSFN